MLVEILDVSVLEEHFHIFTISSLEKILTKAKSVSDPVGIKKLQLDLLSVLQEEMSIGKRKRWERSPSGENHLIVSGSLCLFINIDRIIILVENCLLDEGELVVKNIEWSEDDHLLLFDLFYPVHSESQKCICHYAEKDPFVYFTQISKTIESLQENTSAEDFNFDEWL